MNGNDRGTWAYLFTDVVGSTRLWEDFPHEMSDALAEHDRIAREVLAEYQGDVFSTAGDSFAAAFATVEAAAAAAIAFQQQLDSEPWPALVSIESRMGIHVGETERRDGGYFGAVLNQAARLMSSGHGRQVLLSAAAKRICESIDWIDSSQFVDLGEHRLKDLGAAQRIWQLTVPGLPDSFAALTTLNPNVTNLPVQLTEFYGRESDRARIADYLQQARLVTIHGLGGMGKTRLSLQVGGDLSSKFSGGLWFVELAPVRQPEGVPYAVAEALGVAVAGGVTPTEAVARSLSDHHALIILDNCEHLIDAATELASALLSQCPNIKILATSRVNLNVAGELMYNLQPLDGGTPDAPAVELFVQRALAANPALRFDDERYRLIAALCDQLDRIPLAIELAAARTRSMTPEDIAEHLDQRFRLLRTTGGVEDRHRRLVDTVDWSYRRLTDEAQLLFRRLSVFTGSFALDAAQAVCGDDDLDEFEILDTIEELVDHSMIAVDIAGTRAQYQLLETLRDFGMDQLGEDAAAMRDRHAQYYASAIERIAHLAMSPDEADAWVELDELWDDLRSASAYARAAGDAKTASQLVTHLSFAALWRSRLEGSTWADATISLDGFDDIDAPTRLGVLSTAAAGLMHGEGAVRSRQLNDQAAEIARGLEPADADFRLAATSTVFFFLGALNEGVAFCAELNERVHERVQFLLHASSSQMHSYLGQRDVARREVLEAARLAEELDGLPPTWLTLVEWGSARHGGLSTQELLNEMPRYIATLEATGSHFVAHSAQRALVALQATTVDLSTSLRETAEALREVDRSDPRNATGWLLMSANGLLKTGHYRDAAMLLAWQEKYRVAPVQPVLQAELDENLGAMNDWLGEDGLAQAHAAVDEMSFADVVDHAITSLTSVCDELVAT